MEFNWIAILVAGVATFMIGGLWYSPMLFGKAWQDATGMTDEKVKGGGMLPLIAGFFLSFLAAMFISIVVGSHEHPDARFGAFGHGAFHGGMIAAFVILPTMVTNALYELKGLKYILINFGYWFVSFCVMGGILDAWSEWF